jgi:hypothetical protein
VGFGHEDEEDDALLADCEFCEDEDEGAGSVHAPVQLTGGLAVGVVPPGMPTSAGRKPPSNAPNRRSHQSLPSLFLSPGGPVTFFGGEFDAVGTATTETYDGGAVKVTLDAETGGTML